MSRELRDVDDVIRDATSKASKCGEATEIRGAESRSLDVENFVWVAVGRNADHLELLSLDIACCWADRSEEEGIDHVSVYGRPALLMLRAMIDAELAKPEASPT